MMIHACDFLKIVKRELIINNAIVYFFILFFSTFFFFFLFFQNVLFLISKSYLGSGI